MTYLWIQLGMIILFVLIGLWHHQRYGWQGGFFFSSEDNFKFMFFIIVPTATSFFSLVLGSVYFLSEDERSWLLLTTLLILPFSYLLIVIGNGFIQGSIIKSREKKIYKQQQKVQNWIEQFPFIHEKDVYKNFRGKKGKLEGILTVQTIKENESCLLEKKEQLPEGIKLETRIRTKKEDEWLQQVRNWIKSLNVIETRSIKDYTHYNEENKYKGSINIVADPVHFDLITEKAKELPEGIEINLCKHQQLIGSLWHFAKENPEYLDTRYPGEWKVFKTQAN